MNALSELQEQVNELARAHQSTREELQHERQRREQRDARDARGRRVAKTLVAVVLAVAMVSGGTHEVLAWGGCTQTLPGPLKTFCSGDPALSKDINGNFQTLVNWMQEKVGPVGNKNVTVAGTATVAGQVYANGGLAVKGSETVSGKLSAQGGLDVTGSQNVSSSLIVKGKTYAQGGLAVTGDQTVTGNLTVKNLYPKYVGATTVSASNLVAPSCGTTTDENTFHTVYGRTWGSCAGKSNGALGFTGANGFRGICICDGAKWHCMYHT
mgnify:CR=1 FL=1